MISLKSNKEVIELLLETGDIMLDKWNVYNRRTYAGVLIYDDEKEEFSFELKSDHPKAKEAVRLLNADKDKKWFKETIFDRLIPENAVDIREELNELHMIKYDPWELVKYSRLMGPNDLIWMTKGNDPNEFYEIHVFGQKCKEYDRKHPEYTD